MASAGLDGDLDARRPSHARAAHRVAQLAASCERLGLLDGREAVQNEHLLRVSGVNKDLVVGAAMLLTELVDPVVHGAPRAVVVDPVAHEQGAIVLPDASMPSTPNLRSA